MNTDMKCSICCGSNETLSHLFFYCSFSDQVWGEILKLLGKNRNAVTFDEEVLAAATACRRSNPKVTVAWYVFCGSYRFYMDM